MNAISSIKKRIPERVLFIITQACLGVFSVLYVYYYYQTKNSIAFVPFPLIFFAVTVAVYPPAILFMFIGSFYWGQPVWSIGKMFLSWPHLFFILVLLGFVSTYLFGRDRLVITCSKKIVVILVLFLFWAFLSSLCNAATHAPLDRATSFSYVGNVMLLCIAFIVFSSGAMKEWKNHVITTVLVLSVLEIPVVIFQAMALGEQSITSLRNVVGTFGSHHSMVANMMTFPLGFGLMAFLKKQDFRRLIWPAVLVILSLYAIIFSGSRGNIIGIFGAAFIVAILKVKIKKAYFYYVVLSAAGVLLLFVFSPLHHLLSGTIRSSETGTLDISSFGRLIIWKNVWTQYWGLDFLHKLVGIGMANLMATKFSGFFWGSHYIGGAHNNFLNVLLETGLVGIVLFLALFAVILVKLFRQSRHDPLAFGYFYISLSLLISGITQETFWFQPVFGCLWLFYTCLLALILNEPRHGNGGNPSEIQSNSR